MHRGQSCSKTCSVELRIGYKFPEIMRRIKETNLVYTNSLLDINFNVDQIEKEPLGPSGEDEVLFMLAGDVEVQHLQRSFENS